MSKNAWDWLGPGVYFWEQNPGRALEYAIEVANGHQKNNGSIKNPFVIGAIIELGNCLNMLEPNSINIVQQTYNTLQNLITESGEKKPLNKGANRRLDCAVINAVHETNKRGQIPPYDSVRSSFIEGEPIYPDSNFYERLHIEICVLNTSLIKGYFLPRPIEEFNPYLHKEFDKLQRG